MRKFLRFIDKLRADAKQKNINFWSTIGSIIGLTVFLGFPMLAGMVVYRGLADAGRQALGILSFVIVGMLAFFLETEVAPQIYDLYMSFCKEPQTNVESLESRYIEKKMPYFGEKLGNEFFDKVTEKEKYFPYVYADGHASEIIKINEADKWINIDGQFFPLDLIYGYNLGRNEIYTVNGRAVKLSFNLIKKQRRTELRDFLKKRGCFRDEKIAKAGTFFNRAFGGHEAELTKADWAKGRYDWEKKIANEYYVQSRINGFTPFDENGDVNPEIYTRVFSKYELSKVMMKAAGNADKLAQLFDFNRYANEYTLCNGAELVRLMNDFGYAPGIDFLLDCLCDVDEACFHVAVSVLKEYPENSLREKLEERAKLAFESEDAMHLAGILYLAKEMKMPIRYIDNLRNGIFDGEAKEFSPDEEQREPVAFEIGGAAYLKQ